MTCCGCTTSKCAGSSACGPAGCLCLQGAVVEVVLRREDLPIPFWGDGVGGKARSQGSWEPNGHTRHLSQQIFTQTLCAWLCARG